MNNIIELQIEEIKELVNGRLIHFIGDLAGSNVKHTDDIISGLFNQGIYKIIADFKKLRYITSTGLGILLHFSQITRGKKGFFKITNINENVYEIIEIVGANSLLEIHQSNEHALDSAE